MVPIICRMCRTSYWLISPPFQKVRLQCGAKYKAIFQKSLLDETLSSCRTDGRRSLQSSARNCKIWEVPSEAEAKKLKETYYSPKSLIHDLLQPLVDSGMTPKPQMVFTSKLHGRFWRAKLHLHWPGKVTISAVHATVAGAEENAYLLACDLFQHMGLLYKHTCGLMMPVTQDYVIDILKTVHGDDCFTFFGSSSEFQLVTAPMLFMPQDKCVTTLSSETGVALHPVNHLWRTDIIAAYPRSFSVCSFGPSVEASQYAAALLTNMKLKALGLLTGNNYLAADCLPNFSRQISKKALSREQFDPHYEIYSDASYFGFGAYLLQKDNSRVHWFTSRWAEHFPHCPRISTCKVQDSSDTVYLDSTFCELYSVVTACFTWKHKFVRKRVLVWTDNIRVVELMNMGLGVRNREQHKRMAKLFCILSTTCRKYSIELRANHLRRTENVAADLLSRSKLAAFREAVPEAAPSQKKSKKLQFWNPLQSMHHEAKCKVLSDN